MCVATLTDRSRRLLISSVSRNRSNPIISSSRIQVTLLSAISDSRQTCMSYPLLLFDRDPLTLLVVVAATGPTTELISIPSVASSFTSTVSTSKTLILVLDLQIRDLSIPLDLERRTRKKDRRVC